MRFRLLYTGLLATNGSLKQKQALRRAFHPQIAALWRQPPLVDHVAWIKPIADENEISLIKPVGPFSFATLITPKLSLVAELHILLFRPSAPGSLLGHGGDIDNRLKTLLDALRLPTAAEIPPDDTPQIDENPFHCLLEDDVLVTHVHVDTERLLMEAPANHVHLVVTVTTRPTVVTWGNIGLSG